MSSKKIAVIAVESEAGKKFVQGCCSMPAPAESGFVQIGDVNVQLELIADEDPEAKVDQYDATVLLVHHMDILSVNSLRRIYRALEKKPELSTVVSLFKGTGEKQYKISCFECGQKIWVPEDKSKSQGKCPKCWAAFELLTREEHARLVLGLVEGVDVKTVPEGDTEACKSALELLLADKSADEQSGSHDSESKPKIRIKKKQSMA